MSRRLFDDLVVSGSGTARSPSFRTLPLSLAVHGMAVAALATLSMTAAREAAVPASPVVFHASGPERAAAPTRAAEPRTARPARRTETQPVLVDARPPVVSNIPPSDVDTGSADAPVADIPLCLSGCVPGGSGAIDGWGIPGPGGTGEGPGPPRRVGGDIREPRRIRGALPVYPELARRAHVEGKVVLECVIDVDGRVTDLRVMSGHPLLADAARDAVRHWEYIPTRLNGQPVPVILVVTVHFGLDKN